MATLKYEFKNDKEEKAEKEKSADGTSMPENSHVEKYTEGGHLRYIIFDDHNGMQLTQYYSYLVNIHFEAPKNEIRLEFSDHIVTLKGQNFAPLFEELSAQLIRKLKPFDKRYGALMDKSDYFVTDILFSRVLK